MARGELRLGCGVAEAAESLAIGRSTAYDLVARGQLPTVRLGRRVIVTRPTLSAFLRLEPPLPHELDHARCTSDDRPEPAPPSPASIGTPGPSCATFMRVHLLTTVELLTPSTTDECTGCAGSRCSCLGRWPG